MRIVIIASLTASLVNFRLELLKSLVRHGHDVVALAPENDVETIAALKEIGVGFRQIPMARTGINPFADLKTLWSLYAQIRDIDPDVVLPYTMKPIIYGGLAARLHGVRDRYALLTGFGHVFIDGETSLKRRALRSLSAFLYRKALRGAKRVFVYNRADAHIVTSRKLAREDALMLISGSGIDTAKFAAKCPPAGRPVFLMVARLLWEKGIAEYAEAARMLRARHPEIRCQLLGPFDCNPSAISAKELIELNADEALEYLGEAKDVRPYLAACSVLVLPSYREGLSRTVLEAMSTGRAVVVSDAPGCGEPVINEKTGLVVPVRNAEKLYEAMERFVDEPALAAEMGCHARDRAEKVFDVHKVNRMLLAAMGLEGKAAARKETCQNGLGTAKEAGTRSKNKQIEAVPLLPK